VARALAQWPIMLAMAALIYAQVALTSGRWQALLDAQQIPLTFGRTWGLTMIGMLFNVVVPGAVGGDFVKGYYITRAASSRKSYAATSILMDRAAGVAGLFLFGAAAVAANMREAVHSSATRSLTALTFAGAAGSLAALYLSLFAGGALSRWRVLPVAVRRACDALHQYRKRSKVVLYALALSIVNQGLTCFLYFLALRAVGASGLSSGQFFLIVPLGLTAAALPISPAGLGVGQAAFLGLFRIVSPAYATAGVNAITVYQVIVILVCLTGLYWYVSYRHEQLPARSARKLPHTALRP